MRPPPLLPAAWCCCALFFGAGFALWSACLALLCSGLVFFCRCAEGFSPCLADFSGCACFSSGLAFFCACAEGFSSCFADFSGCAFFSSWVADPAFWSSFSCYSCADAGAASPSAKDRTAVPITVTSFISVASVILSFVMQLALPYCKLPVVAFTGLPMASPETRSSTLRFCCRPEEFSFEATGKVLPKPRAETEFVATPSCTR